MKTLPVRILLLCLLITIVTVSCSPTKYASKMDTAAIPPDFNPNKHKLLIAEILKRNGSEERDDAATREMDNAFKQYYKYKYEIVSQKEMETNSKYKDTSVYKFILLSDADTYTKKYTGRSATGSGSYQYYNGTATFNVINFNFYDRPQEHGYPSTMANSKYVALYCRTLIALIDRALQERK